MRVRVGQFVAFFFRSLLWSLNLLLVVYTCLAYWLLYSLQIEHWSAGMIMITIPVVWVLNIVVVCLWLTSRPWRSWLSGLLVIAGILLFGSRTFAWHSSNTQAGTGIPLKVFSYNVHSFDEMDVSGSTAKFTPVRRTTKLRTSVRCPHQVFSGVLYVNKDTRTIMLCSGLERPDTPIRSIVS